MVTQSLLPVTVYLAWDILFRNVNEVWWELGGCMVVGHVQNYLLGLYLSCQSWFMRLGKLLLRKDGPIWQFFSCWVLTGLQGQESCLWPRRVTSLGIAARLALYGLSRSQKVAKEWGPMSPLSSKTDG